MQFQFFLDKVSRVIEVAMAIRMPKADLRPVLNFVLWQEVPQLRVFLHHLLLLVPSSANRLHSRPYIAHHGALFMEGLEVMMTE